MTDVSFGRDVKNWSLYENIFVRDKSFGNFIGWTYWCKFTNTNWYMIEWWSELSEYRHQIAQLVEIEGARVWIPVLSIIISTIPTFTTFFTNINKQTSLVTGIWWKKHFDEDSVGQVWFCANQVFSLSIIFEYLSDLWVDTARWWWTRDVNLHEQHDILNPLRKGMWLFKSQIND